MPKVTEAHREARREQILQAAWRCFGRNGFHETTLQDICGEAELSPGAVYCYFDSKDGIIEGLARLGRSQQDALLGKIREERSLPARLSALVDWFGDCLELPEAEIGARVDISVWAAALTNERLMALVRRAFHQLNGGLAELIREGQAEGELDPELAPRSVARALTSLLLGVSIQGALAGEVDARQDMAVLESLVARGLGTGGE